MGRNHLGIGLVKKVMKKKNPTVCKVDKTQCKKCLYQPPKVNDFDNIFGCYYIFYTGHRRPSEPSPNCTAFKKYNEKERKVLDGKLKEDYAKGAMIWPSAGCSQKQS